MSNAKRKRPRRVPVEPLEQALATQPETVPELLNQYGTYEIQPTANSENRYPCLAQGLPREPEEPSDRS